MMLNGNWQMIDQNGDTVDSFPPFSTLKEDEPETTSGYEIHDDGYDSPRVIGEVTGRTETASEGGSSFIFLFLHDTYLNCTIHNLSTTK